MSFFCFLLIYIPHPHNGSSSVRAMSYVNTPSYTLKYCNVQNSFWEYRFEKNSRIFVVVKETDAFQLDLLKLMLATLRTYVSKLIFTETAVSVRFTDFQVVGWIMSLKRYG